MKPWDHHSALTQDRLSFIAELIIRGRNNALDRYDVEIGSNGWTVGCEAFAFQKFRIIQAAERSDWLSILDPGMQFVFCVGGVPIRFYRGEPTDPNERTLRQSYVELTQLGLFDFGELEGSGAPLLYRFAVQTDIDGSVIDISFVILSGAIPILVWPVPLDSAATTITELRDDVDEGVELPAPIITIPYKETGEEKEGE